jgi:uncharacterized phiE125 gp8 family phage protein
MPLTIITPPAAEPVTVEEAKSFARVEDADEDALIETLITAAREHVEQATGRSFVVSTYGLTLRCFEPDVIRLPRSPLVSVESVTYRDRDGASNVYMAAARTPAGSRSSRKG